MITGAMIAGAIESLTPGRIAAYLLLLTVGSFILDFTWKPRYTKSLPRVGFGDNILGSIKNWCCYATRFNAWVTEGYEKYSKHDQAFVVPAAPSRPHEIVVPRSQTAWMLELPEQVLSAKEAHSDVLYSEYQFFGVDDRLPVQTIHKHLARNIVGLIPSVQDEIHSAIDAVFGKDTKNWKSINLWEAWLGVIPRVTNRIIVGAPLCRNEEFLKSQVAFADDIVRNSFFLNLFPRIFQPLVAPVFTLSNWWHWRKSYTHAKPVLDKRLDDMARKASGADPAYDDWEPPEDMITWLIRQAEADRPGSSANLTAETLSKAVLPVQFAAIHTTVITGFNLFLDLLSSDPSLNYLATIREETARVLRGEPSSSPSLSAHTTPYWTKHSLSLLHRTDSAIKESMRLSHFARAITHRKVVAPEGVTNPAGGWHAPPGAFLMLDLVGTHRDPALYEEPDRYDAWRFSRVREEYEAASANTGPGEAGGRKGDAEEAMRIKRLGMVTTSPEYLPFSHGRHACPGRFFVAHELKMILAYLVNNYEFKPLPEKPEGFWFGANLIPPVQIKIEIRRREGTV